MTWPEAMRTQLEPRRTRYDSWADNCSSGTGGHLSQGTALHWTWENPPTDPHEALVVQHVRGIKSRSAVAASFVPHAARARSTKSTVPDLHASCTSGA